MSEELQLLIESLGTMKVAMMSRFEMESQVEDIFKHNLLLFEQYPVFRDLCYQSAVVIAQSEHYRTSLMDFCMALDLAIASLKEINNASI